MHAVHAHRRWRRSASRTCGRTPHSASARTHLGRDLSTLYSAGIAGSPYSSLIWQTYSQWANVHGSARRERPVAEHTQDSQLLLLGCHMRASVPWWTPLLVAQQAKRRVALRTCHWRCVGQRQAGRHGAHGTAGRAETQPPARRDGTRAEEVTVLSERANIDKALHLVRSQQGRYRCGKICTSSRIRPPTSNRVKEKSRHSA